MTIVEWSDFQCPFCSQAKDLVHQILEAYPKDVRFVFKNYPLPFHQQAMPAAKAAIAAGKQGKFFEMHDKLFENQKALAPEKYEEFAPRSSASTSTSSRRTWSRRKWRPRSPAR